MVSQPKSSSILFIRRLCNQKSRYPFENPFEKALTPVWRALETSLCELLIATLSVHRMYSSDMFTKCVH